jgi:G3E family GTPase
MKSAKRKLGLADGSRTGPRFILIGGFLGAGKTTVILRLALHLQKQGKRVGIITNDQAEGLVDTALAARSGLPVREITGGCFCCKSKHLIEALQDLASSDRPDVFIAEPVGSCTDLVATVGVPLKQIYQQEHIIAPYSVIVDPFRADQILNNETTKVFSKNVAYIYCKQLEEAEVIVINKTDVFPIKRVKALREVLADRFPQATICQISARADKGMAPLFLSLMEGESSPSRIMKVDYQKYGKGEAELGWYNARVQLKSARPKMSVPAKAVNHWLACFANALQAALCSNKIEIAHLKAVIEADNTRRPGDLAAVNLVSSQSRPELARLLRTNLRTGVLLINLRAACAPSVLRDAVSKVLLAASPLFERLLTHEEAFRPAQPNPTNRIGSLRASHI